ncbi:MAG: ATP-binding protein [Planctomycetes bacterium]|nr:ATP-binding protein [Planctomycetota bacterium]
MTYTGEYLQRLLNELRNLPKETEWVEFKHNNADHQEIGEQISAIANSAALAKKTCGYLVWGIEDSTHNILKYVQRDYLTNSSLRERFGIQKENSSMVSRIIKEALEDKAIKFPDPESESRKYARYVPVWA